MPALPIATRNPNSILFVNPDYHCSFFLRNEFRRLGWQADVLKNSGYPVSLLWSDDCITAPDGGQVRAKFLTHLAVTYKYFVCYGDAEVLPVGHTFHASRWLSRILGSWELAYLKLHGCKMAFFPSGCRQEVLRADFAKHQDGRVCANCGYADTVCNEKQNAKTFKLVNRFHSLAIENTQIPSTRIKKTQVKYKSLDLDVFSPDAVIPAHLKLPDEGRMRIMHSFYDKDRTHSSKNIKGSPFVSEAVQRLKSEGYPVEYFYVHDIPSRDMRYYQLQADIVVDQLIYGWWGSTAIESLALGKPTVCFLWPEWKRKFLESYPEYETLPIVEAGTDNIYEVLKGLVEQPERRRAIGAASRLFATQHFDVHKNAPALATLLRAL